MKANCKTCNNTAAQGRSECNQCRYLRRKSEDPVKLSYYNLKSSAKRRNKDFQLTLDEFREFCNQHHYIDKKGRTVTGYHIDRVIEELGYVYHNLQILPNPDNVKKYRAFVSRENGKAIFTTKVAFPENAEFSDDCPF